MADLDEYEAFQFDMGVAWKGHLRDKENETNQMYSLLEGMAGIMRSNRAKVSKLPKPEPLIKDPRAEEAPRLSDVISALGGKGVTAK